MTIKINVSSRINALRVPNWGPSPQGVFCNLGTTLIKYKWSAKNLHVLSNSAKFSVARPLLESENMPWQLRIVDRVGGSSWQSYQIIATRLVDFHFYRASYASAVLAVIACLSDRPSVCPSVTSRRCTKMVKPRITITLTTPCDSPGTLVFRRQKSRRNSNITLYQRTTLPLKRSTAATLCSPATLDANDAFALAERYRSTAINWLRLLFISTDSVLVRFHLH